MTLSAEDRSVADALPPVGPLGMHHHNSNSALVLKDEDGNSIGTELEEWASDANLAPAAAINVENSSDVIIGPVTQFNGPVTIYQNVNGNGTTQSIEGNGFLGPEPEGKLVKSESTSSDVAPSGEAASRRSSRCSTTLKLIVISLAVLVAVAVIATATILSLKSRPQRPTPEKQTDDPDDFDDDGPVPAGPGLVIGKHSWGGRPALKWNTSLELRHPTRFVIISHTVTPQCHDFDDCSKRVQQIQTFHVGSGKSPDIGYNFVVGGDGNAYVGRGWDTRNFHKDNSIGISFIGNYVYDYLTPEMIAITKKLLEEGVQSGKLERNYLLVAHNQTYSTESPGAHVYQEIKTWPHFDPKRYI